MKVVVVVVICVHMILTVPAMSIDCSPFWGHPVRLHPPSSTVPIESSSDFHFFGFIFVTVLPFLSLVARFAFLTLTFSPLSWHDLSFSFSFFSITSAMALLIVPSVCQALLSYIFFLVYSILKSLNDYLNIFISINRMLPLFDYGCLMLILLPSSSSIKIFL